MIDFRIVAEDICMLRERWLSGDSQTISEADLRRGSSSLSVLLTDNLAARAWRALGHAKQPNIVGPNLEAWAERKGYDLRMSVSILAGGGRLDGVDTSFLGAMRLDNPETGIKADADEGFALRQFMTVRAASPNDQPSEHDDLIFFSRPVSAYLDSASGVHMGRYISWRDVLRYFRNSAGGSHHSLGPPAKRKAKFDNELIEKFQRQLIVNITDGLHFELLSIGQSVARSPDFLLLEKELGSDARWSTPWKKP